MTIAEQDQLGRELTDLRKRLARLEQHMERMTATRTIHMDPVGAPTYVPERWQWQATAEAKGD